MRRKTRSAASSLVHTVPSMICCTDRIIVTVSLIPLQGVPKQSTLPVRSDIGVYSAAASALFAFRYASLSFSSLEKAKAHTPMMTMKISGTME